MYTISTLMTNVLYMMVMHYKDTQDVEHNMW